MARLVSLERVGPLSPDEGLGDADVAARRARWGTNELLQVPGRSWADVARDTARDPMLWFLVATGAVYAALGEVVEALTLLGAAGPLVAMDSYLHRRTRASLAALGSALAAEARVVRAGAERRVPPADLVPGDLVLLGPGDAVPADGLVVAADGLQVDESTLTGESLPERKRPATPPRAAGPEVPVEDAAWVSAGTRVLAGRARVRVALTGAETLYGQIVRQAVGGGGATTPLQAAVRQLVLVLLGAALLLCGALALVRLRQGAGLLDALVSAATLAVAALPEEFPVAVTVFLGVGVFRLARRRALVRRAVTVETIGRVTVICTDKTGTITEGRLRVAHLLPAGGTPEALLSLVALACDPESGDPLDEAIADASARQGLEPTAAEALAAFPFTEDRRRATRVLRRGGADLLAVTKGAPEVVLAATQLARDEQAAWAARTTELAASGHKVVACAWRPLQDWAGGEPDRGLTFAGLVALEDPVRAGVAEAVRGCRAAGIHVVMVTGDHPGTAAAVAREVGLGG
ncbi:MAG: cation-transporting P-type ATPase, partial [Planctomycetota bacterium]|nr:cation-transporting P-type ATPase [Planctomycetota bacterium]